jgi:hypothetical protein
MPEPVAPKEEDFIDMEEYWSFYDDWYEETHR